MSAHGFDFGSRKTTDRAIRWFFVLVFFPMMTIFPYMGATNNPNENVRTYMTMALVEQHELKIDEVVRRFGWVNDMAKVPTKDGLSAHYFSVKAPAVSLAGVPAYWAFSKIAPRFKHHYPKATSPAASKIWWMRMTTWICRLFAVQLPCFLFLIWFERYLRGFTDDVVFRLSAVAACGLGTNYLAYNHMFASHALFAVAAFLAFGLIEREFRVASDPNERLTSAAFFAGFCCGWATLLEYHALPVSVVFALFGMVVFRKPKKLIAFVAGGLIHAITMMLFQWRAYGNPLTPGHKMVESAQFAAEHHRGVFGVLLPNWDAFRELSIGAGYGFFGLSPFMWLGLLAIVLVRVRIKTSGKTRTTLGISTAVWMIAMLLLWLINAGAIEWRAGWTIGPRYLGAAPPFFAFGAVCAFEYLSTRERVNLRVPLRGIAGGLAAVSVVSIGTVGSLHDTLPTFITRPFTQTALPLIRTGFAPHHVLEWFGWETNHFFYFVLACLLGAPVLAAFIRAGDTWKNVGLRGALFVIAFGVGAYPLYAKPGPLEPVADAEAFIGGWSKVWEPPGRDWVTKAREHATASGESDPCLWIEVGRLERILKLEADAIRDEARAKGDTSHCRR